MVPGEATLNLDTSRIVGLGNSNVTAMPNTGFFTRIKNTFWGSAKTPTSPPVQDPVFPMHSPDTLLSSIDTDSPNNVVLHSGENLEENVIQEYHKLPNGDEVVTQRDDVLDVEVVSVKSAPPSAEESGSMENRNDNQGDTEDEGSKVPPVVAPAPVRLRQDSGGYPHVQGASELLNAEQLAQLHEKIPIVLQFDTWIKLYSVLDNGADLSTFYNSTAYSPYSIIMVQTYDNEVFGGFASDIWKPSTKFYGSGESFVFKVGKSHAIYLTSNVSYSGWSGRGVFVVRAE